MSNLAFKLNDEDEESFFNAQKERAERKARFKLIQGGGGDNENVAEGDDDSYSDADDNGEASELTPAQLQEREASAKTDSGTPPPEEEAGFFNDKDRKRPKSRFAGTRNQRVAVGVFVSLIVSFTAFILSIASGPAQFLHLTQMMDKFHFSSQQDDGESRMFKFMKYVRNRNKPQNNRLGVLGNKLADKWEAKLSGSGLDLQYNSAGYPEKFVIDPEKLVANGEADGLRSTNPDDVKAHFRDNLGVNLTTDPNTGRLVAEFEGLGFRQARALDKIMLRAAGYGKLGSKIRMRIISKRQGITLNPIKKLQKWEIETRKAWIEKQKAKFKNGESTINVNDPAATQDNDGDGRPDGPSQDDVETKAKTDEFKTTVDGEAASATDGSTGRFEGASGRALQGLGVASLVVGATCMAQGLSSEFDKSVYAKIAQPLIRMAADNVAIGSQMQSSTMLGLTLDTTQLGYASKSFTDNNGASWVSARSIQAENGQELTGPDIPEEARINKDGNPIGQLLNAIPGIDPICGAVNSTAGQVVGFGVDVITSGGFIGPIISQGVSQLILPKITDGFLASISPDPLDVAEAVGPKRFGNFVNYGSRLMANDSALAAGGRALTNTETTQLKLEQMETDKEEFAQKSLASRLFDTSDYRSLASRIMTDHSSKFTNDNLSNLAVSLFNVSSTVRSFSSALRPASVSAATAGYNYGFPKIGFSVAERDDPRLDDPYANSSIATESLKNSDYRDRVSKCFGVIVSDSDFSVTSGSVAPNYGDLSDPNNNCNDQSETWLRIRRYIADTQYMEAYACYEAADDQACQNVGMPGPTNTSADQASSAPNTSDAPEKIDPSKLGYSSENIACAPGTNDLGVVTSRYRGNLKKEAGPLRTRLCQIPDLPGKGNNTSGASISGGAVVDAYVSGAWAALARQAKADGVSLSAGSSFRLADSCGGTGDGSACARPGTSMHQTGWAIDFSNMKLKGSSTTSCSGRARMPSNAGWAWMDANAPKYGIKQYTYEAWHWDPAPLDNRCGTGQ